MKNLRTRFASSQPKKKTVYGRRAANLKALLRNNTSGRHNYGLDQFANQTGYDSIELVARLASQPGARIMCETAFRFARTHTARQRRTGYAVRQRRRTAMRIYELKARSFARAPCALRTNSRSRESRQCGPPVLSTRPARLRSCCAPVGTGVHLT